MRFKSQPIDKKIAALAIPSIGALIAEPLFLAVDSALVGHLGATPLAGLAIASAILTTVIGLMIFLAYSTTPLVAKMRGAGKMREAVQAGIDGVWLAFGLGVLVAALMWFFRWPLINAFGADAAVAEQAEIYLRISALGVPAMLITFAAMGLLRGLQDTITPLYVAVIGFTVNALLNWLFIYGFGMQIAGSAWGTVVAQWGMVAVYLVFIVRLVKKNGASFLPHIGGFKEAGQISSWLFVRTVGLRVALVATVAAVAGHGAAATAGYQIVFIIISIASYGLDALSIAAQALIGESIGARNALQARQVVSRTLFWGFLSSLGLGLLISALSPFIGKAFTNDAAVLQLLPAAILIVGLTLPLSAVVYVLDGVLIGAGDARYLAVWSVLTLIIYLPGLWITTVVVPSGAIALTAIALAFTLYFMFLRATVLWLRVRGDAWLKFS